jgi:hypothetical protein
MQGKVAPVHTIKAHTGNKGIAPFLNLSTRLMCVVNNFTPWPLYPLGEGDLEPIQYEAGWTPEPVWTVLENRKKFLFQPGYEAARIKEKRNFLWESSLEDDRLKYQYRYEKITLRWIVEK